MKKVWIITFLIFLVGLIIWLKGSSTNRSALSIKSEAGILKVYIDNRFIGNSPLSFEGVSSGFHRIELKRTADVSYPTFSTEINFLQGTNAFIDWNLGPTGNFSSGYITYFAKYIPQKLAMDIKSSGANIYVDNVLEGSGEARLNNISSKVYNIMVAKKGYESLSFKVTPQKGYILVAKVNLFLIPYNINT